MLQSELRDLKAAKKPGSNVLGNALIFVAILSVVLVAIYAMNKGKEKEHNPFMGAPPVGGAPSGAAGGTGTDATQSIGGQVVLSDEMQAKSVTGTLFIIVRNAGMPNQGPPLAVRRVEEPKFPVEFSVSARDEMVQGVPFTGPFDVYVRLDADGNAMTRDDADVVSGSNLAGVLLGTKDLRVVLDRFAGEPGRPPSPSPAVLPASPPPAAAPGRDEPAHPTAGAHTVVSGRIVVETGLSSDAVGGTLFVMLRAAGSEGRGPPLAVQKFDAPKFPLEFQIGPEDVMMQGVPLVGPFDIAVRLDKDGNAMTKEPGDLINEPTLTGVVAGSAGVEIRLSTRL